MNKRITKTNNFSILEREEIQSFSTTRPEVSRCNAAFDFGSTRDTTAVLHKAPEEDNITLLDFEDINKTIIVNQNNIRPLDIFGDVTPSKNIFVTSSDKFLVNDPEIPGRLKNRHNSNTNSSQRALGINSLFGI